uniref:Uncharacterized protein LOC105137411 n=1 Tax=Rhizophora mucronata TaxID=61149 RepID=A0A2P2L565_RHIMU
MDKKLFDSQKEADHREDSLHRLCEDKESPCDSCLDCSESKLERLAKRVSSQQTLILEVKKLPHNKSCSKDSFLQRIRVFNSWIPKHVVTADEKYLRCCREFIHVSASKTTPCNLSLDWGGNMSILSNDLDPGQVCGERTCNLVGIEFSCPVSAGTGGAIMSPAGQWIVGSIMSSKSMVNILKSPLLQQYGAFNGGSKFQKVGFNDKQAICYDFMSSPGGLRNYPSNKRDKESPFPGSQKCDPHTLHQRFVSVSNTNSTSSDQSCSSLSGTATQGMLQCTWKGGSPHFVFSLDGQNEVYMANMFKPESSDDKALDCMYLFHSTVAGQKGHDTHGNGTHLVGKMKVSTLFTFCPKNSRIMEREFILYGGMGSFVGDIQTPTHDLKKNKGLPKKVVDMFRISQSMKKRTTSRFDGSSSILENNSWELSNGMNNPVGVACASNLLEDHLPPNLELVAIVVKECLPNIHQDKAGGWGLKFLKNMGLKQKTDTEESMVTSTCHQDTGDCSTSVDIVVPAGLHGGPMTRIGGPSSLVERWRSGGSCDCGGWDLGCPLTILKHRSSKKELSYEADAPNECKLTEFFIQDSEDLIAPLRMVNVHDGYYFVNFQSTLSALQSFSIAVAFIHSQNPTLQPKNVQELK